MLRVSREGTSQAKCGQIIYSNQNMFLMRCERALCYLDSGQDCCLRFMHSNSRTKARVPQEIRSAKPQANSAMACIDFVQRYAID